MSIYLYLYTYIFISRYIHISISSSISVSISISISINALTYLCIFAACGSCCEAFLATLLNFIWCGARAGSLKSPPKMCVSRSIESNRRVLKLVWLAYLVLMNEFELLIPWWLETIRVLGLFSGWLSGPQLAGFPSSSYYWCEKFDFYEGFKSQPGVGACILVTVTPPTAYWSLL